MGKKPARSRWYAPLSHWLTFARLHGIIPKKIELLIATAVRNSNTGNPVSFLAKLCELKGFKMT
jgi:hypothetical protein